MLVVLDTNVLVAALRSPRGASRAVLELVLDGAIRIAVTVALALEHEDVLLREPAVHPAPRAAIEALLDHLVAIADRPELSLSRRPAVSDPNDELVLEAALGAGADALVTFNVRDFVGAERHRVRVLTPNALLLDFRGSR